MNTPRTALEECLRLAELATPNWTRGALGPPEWRYIWANDCVVAAVSEWEADGTFVGNLGGLSDDEASANAKLIVAAISLLHTHGKALSVALGGWLPIETAPKDGTIVDLWAGARFPGCKWMVSDARDDGVERWCHLSWHTTFDDWFWIDIQANPTHWRPLPPPPTSANGSEVEGE